MECEEKIEKLLNIIERVANGEYERDNWRGILDSVAELFEADVAAIGENREGYVLYTKLSSYADRFEYYDPDKFKVPLWRSALGEAIKRGYIIVNDYQSYGKAVEEWRRLGLKSVIVAPFGDRNVFGSLAIGRFREGKPFSEEDGKILKSLAFIFSFIIKEDIEKRKLLERAIKDHLTKLYNRFYFEEEGRRELERAKRYGYPLSLIILDLDNFKQINDRFGHQKGDEVLIKFAEVLKKSVRKTDMPVRYGGEEFLVLLPHTHAEEAIKVAERIRKNFAGVAFRAGMEVFRLTVSAGVASCDLPEDCNLEDLLSKADKALYMAKKEGKNRTVVFSHEGIG